MSYICEHCGKLVETETKFGSGRFCSRSCANSHEHSKEWKANISAGIRKETKCLCRFCGKEFNNLNLKASHERFCKENPNRITSNAMHIKKLARNYKTSKQVELDVTYAEIEQYMNKHTRCEICGKTIKEATKWTSKYAPKHLCVDHDHKTLKFRGVLCSVCNRQLGWYEANQKAIEKYLNKNKDK